MKNLVGLGAKRLGFGFVRQRSVSAPGFFFAASGVEERNFFITITGERPGFSARPRFP